MRPKAFSQIKALANEFRNPVRAALAMRRFLELTLSLSQHTCTRDMIERHVKSGLAFNSVKSLVSKSTSSMCEGRAKQNAVKHIEATIMKAKLDDAFIQVKNARKELSKSKEQSLYDEMNRRLVSNF